MSLLERYRAHRRRVLGIDALHDEITALRHAIQALNSGSGADHKTVMESLAEVRGLLGLTPDEVRTPTYHLHGKDPHGLG